MNEKIESFKKEIEGKKVALVGMGISNRAAVDFLLSCGVVLTARDKSDAPDDETAEFLTARGVRMVYGDGYLSELDEDVIFKSPGIRYDVPELLAARARGAVVTSEMEVLVSLCPCRIFAVTGSDGKTTTTTLIAKMLERAAAKSGAHVFLGGNIGTPLLSEVEKMREEDFAVLELSSFQLHTMRFAPYCAVITNVTPNHLNWHTSMEEYIDSKKNLYRYQNAGCRLVLNAENEITRKMEEEASATVTLFSIVNHWNAFFDGVIYINSGTKKPLQTYLQSLVIDQSQFMNMTAEERQRLEELTSKNFNAAKLLVSMIPILAVYPFLQRFFVTGLVLGSVKS